MQWNIGQENRVLVLSIDRLNNFRFVGPDPNRLSLYSQKIGERRAPTAGAEHRDQRHGRGALAVRRPNRFSVPLSSRSIFRRCRTMTPSGDEHIHPEKLRGFRTLQQVDGQRQHRRRRNARERHVSGQHEHDRPDRSRNPERQRSECQHDPGSRGHTLPALEPHEYREHVSNDGGDTAGQRIQLGAGDPGSEDQYRNGPFRDIE